MHFTNCTFFVKSILFPHSYPFLRSDTMKKRKRFKMYNINYANDLIIKYQKIKKNNFDMLFFNIFFIKYIYLHQSLDLFVMVFENNRKYIFHNSTENDKNIFRNLIDIIPKSCRVIMI